MCRASQMPSPSYSGFTNSLSPMWKSRTFFFLRKHLNSHLCILIKGSQSLILILTLQNFKEFLASGTPLFSKLMEKTARFWINFCHIGLFFSFFFFFYKSKNTKTSWDIFIWTTEVDNSVLLRVLNLNLDFRTQEYNLISVWFESLFICI